VRADHAPLKGLQRDRTLAAERGMHRREEDLAQAVALVGIVADRGGCSSGCGGELDERTRGQRERRSVAAALLGARFECVDLCGTVDRDPVTEGASRPRSSSRGSQRLPHWLSSRSEAGVKAAKRRRGALTPRPSGGSSPSGGLRDRILGGWCGRRHNIPSRYVRRTTRPILITVAAADPILLAVARARSRWRSTSASRESQR
jgi:hypothetical protein